MIWLWAYLFIGSLYAAYGTNWLNKNDEGGATFGVGLALFLFWPPILVLDIMGHVPGDEE